MSGAIAEFSDAETQARHAGALGDVDLDHIYPPLGSRIVMTPPLGDVVADLVRRMERVEKHLHLPVNDYGNEVQP